MPVRVLLGDRREHLLGIPTVHGCHENSGNRKVQNIVIQSDSERVWFDTKSLDASKTVLKPAVSSSLDHLIFHLVCNEVSK